MMKSRAMRLAMSGQGLVEYALVLIFVVIVVVGALTVMGGSLSDAYNNIIAQLPF
jgi:pilus assembly protein Flp/PilA